MPHIHVNGKSHEVAMEPDTPLLNLAETPEIDVHIIDSEESPGGVGGRTPAR